MDQAEKAIRFAELRALADRIDGRLHTEHVKVQARREFAASLRAAIPPAEATSGGLCCPIWPTSHRRYRRTWTDVPSAEGPLPPPSDLVGRPYALPVDILGELHGPLFYADYSGFRKLYACSLELVEELCDESRFAKNLTQSLARVRPLAGDGLFTAYHGEPNWQKAHDVLMPGFSYAGLQNYHGAMLDISSQLIARWDACVGQRPVDASTDLQKLAMDTVGLAGFGARFDSYSYDGLAPIPQSFTAAFGELGKEATTTEFDKELAYLHGAFDEMIEQHRTGAADGLDDLLYLMLGQGFRRRTGTRPRRTSATRS